jgi:hypothetical protein
MGIPPKMVSDDPVTDKKSLWSLPVPETDHQRLFFSILVTWLARSYGRQSGRLWQGYRSFPFYLSRVILLTDS